MREIRFRAWDKRTEEMWNVETLHIEDEYVDLFKTNVYEKPLDNPWAKISDVILMQYTGLKDKNGVEVFEGDIVRFKFKNETRIGFVEYVRSSFLINVGEIICDNKIRHSFSNSSSEEHEIIGNVYQNKDLLEESK